MVISAFKASYGTRASLKLIPTYFSFFLYSSWSFGFGQIWRYFHFLLLLWLIWLHAGPMCIEYLPFLMHQHCHERRIDDVSNRRLGEFWMQFKEWRMCGHDFFCHSSFILTFRSEQWTESLVFFLMVANSFFGLYTSDWKILFIN